MITFDWHRSRSESSNRTLSYNCWSRNASLCYCMAWKFVICQKRPTASWFNCNRFFMKLFCCSSCYDNDTVPSFTKSYTRSSISHLAAVCDQLKPHDWYLVLCWLNFYRHHTFIYNGALVYAVVCQVCWLLEVTGSEAGRFSKKIDQISTNASNSVRGWLYRLIRPT